MEDYKLFLLINQGTPRFVRFTWRIHKMMPFRRDREDKRYQIDDKKCLKCTLDDFVRAEFLRSCGHSFGFFVKISTPVTVRTLDDSN